MLLKGGDTVSAKIEKTLAGGERVNEAVCGGLLSYLMYFISHLRKDAHGKVNIEAIKVGSVHINHLANNDLEIVKNVRIVFLHMKIPNVINIQVAKVIRVLNSKFTKIS